MWSIPERTGSCRQPTRTRLRAVTFVPEDFVFTTTDASTWAFEIQNLRRFGEAQIISGLGYIQEDDDFDFEQANITSKAANLYVYGQWKLHGA